MILFTKVYLGTYYCSTWNSTAPYFMQIKAEVSTRHYEALLYQFPLPKVQRSQRRLVENEAREVMGVDRIGPCLSTNTQGTFIFRYSSAWCGFLPCIWMAVFYLFHVFGQIFFSVISDLSHLTLSNLLLLPILSLLFLPTPGFIIFVCPYVMPNILLYCIHYLYPLEHKFLSSVSRPVTGRKIITLNLYSRLNENHGKSSGLYMGNIWRIFS